MIERYGWKYPDDATAASVELHHFALGTTEFTKTDKSFDRAKLDYYIFEKEMVKPWDGGEGRCLNCNTRFRVLPLIEYGFSCVEPPSEHYDIHD